ncbi:MAG: hypothetical protein N4A33_02545 [Bacteriovoracaceae bacterium]|jgi:hypothetical protein|nr:hypothetical protein [Bacteriovoracaceae bacterium]
MLYLDEIDYIIGIDQTGAKINELSAKPLPTIIFEKKDTKWLVHKNQYKLNKMNKNEIFKLLKLDDNKKIVLSIDCVLGLPSFVLESIGVDHFLEVLKKSNFSNKYGTLAAMEYFDNLYELEVNQKYPLRDVEKALNANSVFRQIPFQKNIQAGTFRIWKEISQDIENFGIWCYPKCLKEQIVIFESYPSYAWKFLNNTTRTATNFTKIIQDFNHIENIDYINQINNTDYKDAYFNALFMYYHLEKNLIKIPNSKQMKEGYILGEQFL